MYEVAFTMFMYDIAFVIIWTEGKEECVGTAYLCVCNIYINIYSGLFATRRVCMYL